MSPPDLGLTIALALADHRWSFSVGAMGAIAEFHQDPGERAVVEATASRPLQSRPRSRQPAFLRAHDRYGVGCRVAQHQWAVDFRSDISRDAGDPSGPSPPDRPVGNRPGRGVPEDWLS